MHPHVSCHMRGQHKHTKKGGKMPGTALLKFKYFITLILGTYIYENSLKGTQAGNFIWAKRFDKKIVSWNKFSAKILQQKSVSLLGNYFVDLKHNKFPAECSNKLLVWTLLAGWRFRRQMSLPLGRLKVLTTRWQCPNRLVGWKLSRLNICLLHGWNCNCQMSLR